MRLDPDKRKEEILRAAIVVAARPGGWGKLTREAVAKQANCADALVSRYFGTMPQFRRTIMRRAIVLATPALSGLTHKESLLVIGQGLVCGDAHAGKVSQELRDRAFK